MGVVLVYGVLHYQKQLNLKSLLSFAVSSEINEDNMPSFSSRMLLTANSLFVVSLLALQIISLYSEYEYFDQIFYLQIVFTLLILVGIQMIFLRLYSFLTDTVSFFQEYLTAHSYYIHIASLLCLPLLIIGFYVPNVKQVFILASAVLFALIYFIGILKTIGISGRIKGAFRIHIILYLCGNEILPLLLLYKLLI
jgi:hypothetical protein